MSGIVIVVIIIIVIIVFIVALGSREGVVQQRNQAYEQQARQTSTMSINQLIVAQIINDATFINGCIRAMEANRYNSQKLRELDSKIGETQKRINAHMQKLDINHVSKIYVTWIDGRSVSINQWMMLVMTKYSEFNF